jgi:Trm5-related predicted tRNA methylase
VLIGLALAIVRVMSDRAAYRLEQELKRRKAEQQTGGVDDVDNHHQEE